MPSNHLDDLDLARQDREQRALAALVNGEFSGAEVQVGGRSRETLQLAVRERREQRDRANVVDRQHGRNGLFIGLQMRGQLTERERFLQQYSNRTGT